MVRGSVEGLVEVKLQKQDDFLKVRETLTRIGVASKKEKTLYQSCHILHKKGKYYIVHFKELFSLDGKPTNFSDSDKERRNTIATLLQDWDLIDIIDPLNIDENMELNLKHIKVLSFKEKSDWKLEAKYNIGSKKKYEQV